MRTKLMRAGTRSMLFIGALAMLAPLAFLAMGALMEDSELSRLVGAIVTKEGYAVPPLLPEVTAFGNYYNLLFASDEYLRMFWNSVAIALPALALQVATGAPAAWALARFRFRLQKPLLALYTVLMLLPFQVTMVPAYRALSGLGLLDTRAGIVLYQGFSAMAVFVMHRFFRSIPHSLIESARIDGAGELRVFLHVALPLGAPGILAFAVLSAIELWSAVEPPMLFLRSEALKPLSLFQARLTLGRLGEVFAASVVTAIAPLLLFFFGQSYLEQGIQAAGLKE